MKTVLTVSGAHEHTGEGGHTKPDYLKPIAENIPAELKTIPHWVLWRASWKEKEQKWSKVPYSVHTIHCAKSNDPKSWADFDKVYGRYLNNGFDGIGFVLSADDGFSGVDLDKCRDPETGKIELWARSIIERLDSYTEVSPSGTGIRIFVKAKLPPGRRKKGTIEMYESGRYLTVTGHRL